MADQRLAGVAALDEEVVFLINYCGWNAINGTARPVGSCKRVEVDVLEAMALNNILGLGFLREMTRESAVLVRGPLKVGAQEPVDGAHELDPEFCHKQAFEAFLDDGVFGEVDEIVHV